MLYILDANVLIDAARDYYPFDRVPEFWTWLLHQGTVGTVKIPQEIYDELTGSDDALSEWLKTDAAKAALLLDAEPDPGLVTSVVTIGYAPDLTDDEQLKVGRDPFLIAYALAAPAERRVVSTEVSKPSKTRANRHIPDVCRSLGVESMNTFELLRQLDFRTGWQA